LIWLVYGTPIFFCGNNNVNYIKLKYLIVFLQEYVENTIVFNLLLLFYSLSVNLLKEELLKSVTICLNTTIHVKFFKYFQKNISRFALYLMNVLSKKKKVYLINCKYDQADFNVFLISCNRLILFEQSLFRAVFKI
jgi:hypothetical protein